ncbi:MAG: hypothetical protein MRY63_04020 [Neomegalonema sp.]|nr:hypothetical protein [Neomegalonema sp.]
MHAQQADQCLLGDERGRALRIGMLSTEPVDLCASGYQVIELRNDSGIALGNAQVELIPPLGADLYSFVSNAFELSTDDGATWHPAGAPLGVGTAANPLVWTAAEIPPLARLGAAGTPFDSVLLRWQGQFGEQFGDAQSEARFILDASALDGCGSQARAEQARIEIPIDRPDVIAQLHGRNLTRGGNYSRAVSAAPGDEVEWRLSLENIGDAIARQVRVQLDDGAGTALRLHSDSAQGEPSEIVPVSNLVEQGRRTLLLRETVGPSCQSRETRLATSWGCNALHPLSLSTFSAPPSDAARAELITEFASSDLEIEQSVHGVEGEDLPGDLAEVRVGIRNQGVPLFSPELRVAVPTGFEIDPTWRPEVFAPGSTIRYVALDATNPIQPRFRFTGASEQSLAALDDDQALQLSFRIRRVAPGVLSDSVISSTLDFRDGCGKSLSSLPIVTRFEHRSAELEMGLSSVGEPLVAGQGAVAQFSVDLLNFGDEAAREPRLRLILGDGWARRAPRNCAPAQLGTVAAEDAAEYLCRIGSDLLPGRSLTRNFDLTVADMTGSLAVDAVFEAMGRFSDGKSGAEPIARVEAGTQAVGYFIEQRVLSLSGEPIAPEQPLDVGEEVYLEVAAQWFGIADALITDLSITQTLPEQLLYEDAEQIDGEVEAQNILSPRVGSTGQVLWTLEDFRGSKSFVGRVRAIADARLTHWRGGGAVSGPVRPTRNTAEPAQTGLELAAADADTVFTAFEVTYGIDPRLLSPTRAVPASMTFRSPLVQIGLDFGDRPRRSDGALFYEGGEIINARLELQNKGAAAGYLDWLTLSVPENFEILPFDADHLDNDGNGMVDEPQEAAIVVANSAPPLHSVRWISLSEIEATPVTGIAQQLEPGETRAWQIALRSSKSTPPDFPGEIRLDGQFGARPFAQKGAIDRELASVAFPIRTPPLTGFLVVSATSYGEDLSTTLVHEEQIEHRLSVRFPPGSLNDVAIRIALPPALQDNALVGYRVGRALTCNGGGDPVLEASEAAGGQSLTWRMGDCVANLAGGANDRVAILDFTSRVVDADPYQDAPTRDAWRRPQVKAELSAAEFAQPVALGQTELSIRGPLLRAQARLERAKDEAPNARSATNAQDEPAIGDAGDPLRGALVVENVGDIATSEFIAAFGEPLRAGIDCAALIWGGQRGARSGEDGLHLAPMPICGEVLRHAGRSVAPGEALSLPFTARLLDDAPMDREIALPVLLMASGPQATPVRVGTRSLNLRTAAPSMPVAQMTLAGGRSGAGAALPLVTIGDDAFVRARFAFPEGTAQVRLGLRYRFRSPADPSLFVRGRAIDVMGASLTRDGAAFLSSLNPSGINAAANGRQIEARSAVLVSLGGSVPKIAVADSAATRPPAADDVSKSSGVSAMSSVLGDGWSLATIDLGTLSSPKAAQSPRSGAVTYELAVAIADVPAARAGRLLEVQPIAFVDGRAYPGEIQALARVAEPYLEIGVLNRDDDGLLRPRERFEAEAKICNRGSSPAFGLQIGVRLPKGIRLASAGEAPVLVRDTDTGAVPGLLSAPVAGKVDALTSSALSAQMLGGALAPLECVLLKLPLEVRGAAAAIDAQTNALIASIERYTSRGGAGRQGRIYGGESTSLELQREVLGLSLLSPRGADAVLELQPGERGLARLRLDGAMLAEPVRLNFQTLGAPDVPLSLFIDRDGDGRLGNEEAAAPQGLTLSPGQTIDLLAAVRLSSNVPVGGTQGVVLRVQGLSDRGQVLTSQRELVLRRALDRSGLMQARRFIALDRDCDGDLGDERLQDALFEPNKAAASGECVIMQLRFENVGAASVEQVVVADQTPPRTSVVEHSARFVGTPHGLVADKIDLPSGEDRAIRFHFVGSLAPNLRGQVEYSLRLR